MTLFEVKLGAAVTASARYVALWWEARSVPPEYENRLDKILNKLPPKPGLYAITGKHDAHSSESVLYIGKANRLDKRALVSAEGHLLERHGTKTWTLYSDVWDLTIRWAQLQTSLLLPCEGIMIMSHVPPFNSQQVSAETRRSGPEDDERDLIVMNAGRKGPLLPIVAGAYQTPWVDAQGREIGPVK